MDRWKNRRTGRFFDTCSKDRSENIVVSTPGPIMANGRACSLSIKLIIYCFDIGIVTILYKWNLSVMAIKAWN